jgi:hypothetical protein
VRTLALRYHARSFPSAICAHGRGGALGFWCSCEIGRGHCCALALTLPLCFPWGRRWALRLSLGLHLRPRLRMSPRQCLRLPLPRSFRLPLPRSLRSCVFLLRLRAKLGMRLHSRLHRSFRWCIAVRLPLRCCGCTLLLVRLCTAHLDPLRWLLLGAGSLRLGSPGSSGSRHSLPGAHVRWLRRRVREHVITGRQAIRRRRASGEESSSGRDRTQEGARHSQLVAELAVETETDQLQYGAHTAWQLTHARQLHTGHQPLAKFRSSNDQPR